MERKNTIDILSNSGEIGDRTAEDIKETEADREEDKIEESKE